MFKQKEFPIKNTEKLNEEALNNLRSDEIQSIIGRDFSWVLKWGILIATLAMGILVVIGYKILMANI